MPAAVLQLTWRCLLTAAQIPSFEMWYLQRKVAAARLVLAPTKPYEKEVMLRRKKAHARLGWKFQTELAANLR